jgi:hypothetical protein
MVSLTIFNNGSQIIGIRETSGMKQEIRVNTPVSLDLVIYDFRFYILPMPHPAGNTDGLYIQHVGI